MVELGPPIGMGPERLELGAEQEKAAGLGPKERLDAEPVAGQGEGALIAVPKGEGVHAVQALDGLLGPPLGAGVEQNFVSDISAFGTN